MADKSKENEDNGCESHNWPKRTAKETNGRREKKKINRTPLTSTRKHEKRSLASHNTGSIFEEE